MEKYSRKQMLQQAFIEEYERKDISQISVLELCREIGMSRIAFYHYYEDVYELLQDLEDTVIKDLEEMNREFYRLDLLDKEDIAFCRAVLNYIKERQYLFRALLRHQGTNNFVYRWKKIIKQDFKKKYQFQGKGDVNLDIILELTASAIVGLYEYWLYRMDEISVDDVGKGILQLLCHMLT